jgi:hypothetical protein
MAVSAVSVVIVPQDAKHAVSTAHAAIRAMLPLNFFVSSPPDGFSRILCNLLIITDFNLIASPEKNKCAVICS